jgi:serine/threonine protein kinase
VTGTHKMYMRHGVYLHIEMDMMWGSVWDLVFQKNSININSTRNIMYQVVSALCYLKQKRIVHCDIKPENILIGREFFTNQLAGVKLCDFENSRVVPIQQLQLAPSSAVNPVPFRPPEILLGLPFGYPVDVFAAGCTMTFLINMSLGYPVDECYKPLAVNEPLERQLVIIDKLFGPIPAHMIRDANSRYGLQIAIPPSPANEKRGFDHFYGYMQGHKSKIIRLASELIEMMTYPCPNMRIMCESIRYDQFFTYKIPVDTKK